MRRVTAGAGLLGAAALAFAMRALRWREVEVGGRFVLPVGDAYYHARRALFSAEHWPAVLRFDPLVSHPDGSWIPWPPLHDWLLAAVGRGLGGGVLGVERAATWLPPVLGALAVLPVFLAGSRLGGPGLGLAAAFLLALLPAHVFYTDVGNADHHCLVSLLGAVWLAAALTAATPDASAARRRGAQAVLSAARLAMLLTFPGSLLYLAVADGVQVTVLALTGRARALGEHAAGLVLCALAVAPVIPWLGPPVGGAFSGIALSWLHVVVMGALALGALACALLETRRPTASLGLRAARGAAVAAALAALALALPELRENALSALGFVGKAEPWAARNAEQLPLWRPGAAGGWLAPMAFYGGFAYAIPLVPVAAWWAGREGRRREPAWVLAGWSAALGALAVLQVRYGNDYAPAAAVGFALAVRELAAWLRRPLGPARARLAAGLVAGAATLPLVATPAIQAVAVARARAPLGDPLLATPAGTLYRFAEQVRAATPETKGFEDPTQQPAYGILCPPNVGHVLHWVARRATAADNFGPYAGSSHFREVQDFFRLRRETPAVALARRLDARYVVTMDYGAMPRRSLAWRLQHEDGLARDDAPPFRHFRLITEGPAGGVPLSALFGAPGGRRGGGVPYKLYEVVEGARFVVQTRPGALVSASLALRTPAGRRFTYRIDTTADEGGVARLRLPYPSEGSAPVHALGPWRIETDGDVQELTVPERAVLEGTRIFARGAAS